MSSRESIKIRTFPETAIYDMEYVIGACLRKIVLHVSIRDTTRTNNQEMLMITLVIAT